MDPTGLGKLFRVSIPTICIVDGVFTGSGYNVVNDWLSDVGFFEESDGWTLKLVEVNGAFFDVVFELYDLCDPNTPEPTFEFPTVGGVTVAVINGIGRLDRKESEELGSHLKY
jgi:hypothetical protein